MIRVAIADDHQLFADGVRNALDALPDLRVVLVANDVEGLVAQLSKQPVDVALLDLEMPGGGGLEALRQTKGIASLIVTMHVSPETARLVEDAGAVGLLSKSVPLDDLAAAVRASAAGERLPNEPEARTAVLNRHRKPKLDPGADSLTERETEILTLLARGVSSTEELADRLYISQKTVKNHLASIFQKLSVADRTQAAVEAIRLGLGRPK